VLARLRSTTSLDAENLRLNSAGGMSTTIINGAVRAYPNTASQLDAAKPGRSGDEPQPHHHPAARKAIHDVTRFIGLNSHDSLLTDWPRGSDHQQFATRSSQLVIRINQVMGRVFCDPDRPRTLSPEVLDR
jgi:hypothetical protein